MWILAFPAAKFAPVPSAARWCSPHSCLSAASAVRATNSCQQPLTEEPGMASSQGRRSLISGSDRTAREVIKSSCETGLSATENGAYWFHGETPAYGCRFDLPGRVQV